VKLTDAEVEEVKALIRGWPTQRAAAYAAGTGDVLISRIMRGKQRPGRGLLGRLRSARNAEPSGRAVASASAPDHPADAAALLACLRLTSEQWHRVRATVNAWHAEEAS
jgi:hypothetical protein